MAFLIEKHFRIIKKIFKNYKYFSKEMTHSENLVLLFYLFTFYDVKNSLVKYIETQHINNF